MSEARTGILLEILQERTRQIHQEGYSVTHDDEHYPGELSSAGGNYAMFAFSKDPACRRSMWPWEAGAWKLKDPRSNLIRAAALILAELERHDRKGL